MKVILIKLCLSITLILGVFTLFPSDIYFKLYIQVLVTSSVLFIPVDIILSNNWYILLEKYPKHFFIACLIPILTFLIDVLVVHQLFYIPFKLSAFGLLSWIIWQSYSSFSSLKIISQNLVEYREQISNTFNEMTDIDYKHREVMNEKLKEVEIQKLQLEEEKRINELMLKKVNDLNENLEVKVKAARAEISSVLMTSNQIFFSIDNKGKVTQPISEHANDLFEKNIEGEKVSNILFPNLKPGMKKFEELKGNLFKSFGIENEMFSSIRQTFPKSVELAVGDKSERKVLKISYSPVVNEKNKVDKILCLVEDKTSESIVTNRIKGHALSYIFLKEILLLTQKERQKVADSVSEAITQSLHLLDFLSSSEIEKKPVEEAIEIIKEKFFSIQLLTLSKSLNFENMKYFKEIVAQLYFIKKNRKKDGFVSMDSVLVLSETCVKGLGNFLKYGHELQQFNIIVKTEFKIKEMINFTEDILESQFSNLMEYTLIIRNKKLECVSNEELKQGTINARTNSRTNYQQNIPLIYQRAKKLSVLYSIVGNYSMQILYERFSDCLKLLPKADVVSYLDLRNNLFRPYIEIKNSLGKV